MIQDIVASFVYSTIVCSIGILTILGSQYSNPEAYIVAYTGTIGSSLVLFIVLLVARKRAREGKLNGD